MVGHRVLGSTGKEDKRLMKNTLKQGSEKNKQNQEKYIPVVKGGGSTKKGLLGSTECH